MDGSSIRSHATRLIFVYLFIECSCAFSQKYTWVFEPRKEKKERIGASGGIPYISIEDDRSKYRFGNVYEFYDLNGKKIKHRTSSLIVWPYRKFRGKHWAISQKNDLFGLIDIKGDDIVEPEYEQISQPISGDPYLLVRRSKSAAALINPLGETLVPINIEFSNINSYDGFVEQPLSDKTIYEPSVGLVIVEDANDRKIIVDRKGKRIIESEFGAWIKRVNDNLAIIHSVDKGGDKYFEYINGELAPVSYTSKLAFKNYSDSLLFMEKSVRGTEAELLVDSIDLSNEFGDVAPTAFAGVYYYSKNGYTGIVNRDRNILLSTNANYIRLLEGGLVLMYFNGTTHTHISWSSFLGDKIFSYKVGLAHIDGWTEPRLREKDRRAD